MYLLTRPQLDVCNTTHNPLDGMHNSGPTRSFLKIKVLFFLSSTHRCSRRLKSTMTIRGASCTLTLRACSKYNQPCWLFAAQVHNSNSYQAYDTTQLTYTCHDILLVDPPLMMRKSVEQKRIVRLWALLSDMATRRDSILLGLIPPLRRLV